MLTDKAGTAGGVVAIIYDWLKQQTITKDKNILPEPVEIADNQTGYKHVLIVLGRNPESKLSDPSTWGSNAFVIDGWALGQNNEQGLSFSITDYLANPDKPEYKFFSAALTPTAKWSVSPFANYTPPKENFSREFNKWFDRIYANVVDTRCASVLRQSAAPTPGHFS